MLNHKVLRQCGIGEIVHAFGKELISGFALLMWLGKLPNLSKPLFYHQVEEIVRIIMSRIVLKVMWNIREVYKAIYSTQKVLNKCEFLPLS